MQVIRKPRELWEKVQGKQIGFVPTMGFLHEGHMSLVRRAREENPVVVVSIFVNPLQFGPGEDYARYPRDLDHDRQMLEMADVDILFNPGPTDLYPRGYSTFVEVTGPLTERWEGAHRPGHFRGVTTVVAKLFNLVGPRRAYFGEKDYQQLVVIRRMTQDLFPGVEIVGVPTVREHDGLALSSRNTYLTREHRRDAPLIYRSLLAARKAARRGRPVAEAKAAARRVLGSIRDFRLDYFEIVHPETLEPLEDWVEGARAIVAGRFPEVRLIDNLEVYP